MLADLNTLPSNPSSVHWFGQQARNHLSNARRTTASFFNAKPEEIFFTSGATESNNLILRGLGPTGHVITTSIEHSSIYKTLQSLESQGLSVTYLPVGFWGAPLPHQIEEAIRPDTRAIVLSAANSETGVKIDLPAIGQIAQKHNLPLLLDAVALIGKEPLLLPPSVAAVSLSGHKFHGPKGIGAALIRPTLKLTPTLTGGGQERSRRAGTENLAGIYGLAEALQILLENQPSITTHLTTLQTHLERNLLHSIPDLLINGQGPRTCNTTNLAFLGVDGETLLMHLDLAGVAVSHGSACAAGSLEPSRVLTQMGLDRKTARSSIRLSLARTNTLAEIDLALERIAEIVKKLRRISA